MLGKGQIYDYSRPGTLESLVNENPEIYGHLGAADAWVSRSDVTYPDLKGNTIPIDTRDFDRNIEESPSDQAYHWYRNAETYFLIGRSLAEALISLN